MKSGIKIGRKKNLHESGAALVTVVMISVLLMIACIAMLSAVGSHSRNVTDVLSESKAYYAAESGLQATINVLRGNTDTTPNDTTDDINYIKATKLSTSNYSGDPSTIARLSAWLNYNYPTAGTANRIVIGEPATTYNPMSGTAYSIEVNDPDNSLASITFNTIGKFTKYSVANGAVIEGNNIYIPSKTASPRTVITYNNAASTTNNFTDNALLGSFTLAENGVSVTGTIEFEINYNMTLPRAATRTIYGTIQKDASNNLIVNFRTQNYELYESKIELCQSATASFPCTDVVNLPLNNSFYAHLTPVEPYRLRVLATGYGPNGAKKQLEAILQRDLLNGLASAAATTLIGDSSGFVFQAGTSSVINYSGGNCASANGCVPSFGLTNQTNLDYVNSHPPGGTMTPPPALLDSSNIPDWQRSPTLLNAKIEEFRQTAQNSGRYFVNPTGNQANFGVGTTQNPPGNNTTGTGITFCEGSCKIGADGGGILVVTGKLTNVGGFSFKGIIIVTGEEGWDRTGGGNGSIEGNVIIAPYNRIPYIPENLATAFLAPKYTISGGGVSDVTYQAIGATLNNTSAISDFILGIAEK